MTAPARPVHPRGRYALELLMILQELEAATSSGRDVCMACGCLCLPGELCPGCRALAYGNSCQAGPGAGLARVANPTKKPRDLRH